MQSTLIVGAGPGGTGPLIWAAQHGKLQHWLARGVTVLDRDAAIGGTIGQYVINSDSLGGAYLECLGAPAGRSLFAPLLRDPVTRALEEMRHGFPPLDLVGEHMHNLGTILTDQIQRSLSSEFRPGVRVTSLHLRADDTVAAEAVDKHGRRETYIARSAIMAVGGRQDHAAMFEAALLPGIQLDGADADKIVPSDELFRPAGLARALSLLGHATRPLVLILGGSHSAFSSAWLLTRMLPDAFGPGDIVMMLRRAPRVFYGSRDEALADGMDAEERDICPVTRRVNRLGGLRGDGRELWRCLTGRPGCVRERRVAVMPLTDSREARYALRSMIDEAALIVPAFGYRAGTLPVYDRDGARVRLRADLGKAAVDRAARFLTADRTPIHNLFGIGLGTGYRPWGHMGGEPSFDGQANSLWLYQNHIGEVVYRGVNEIWTTQENRSRFAVTG